MAVATAIHMKIEPCKFNMKYLSFVDDFVLNATMVATGQLGPEDETKLNDLAEQFREIQDEAASFAKASPRKVRRQLSDASV